VAASLAGKTNLSEYLEETHQEAFEGELWSLQPMSGPPAIRSTIDRQNRAKNKIKKKIAAV
jgi:hypothetical protein